MHTASEQGVPFRTRLILALFTLTASVASAQEIVIAPQLKTGDEFRLELKRIRHNSSRPQQNTESNTIVDVRVISSTTAGLVLEWIPGQTAFSNPQVAQDPLLTAASKAVAGLRLRISLNADGEFAGLANQKEVVPKLQAAVDAMTGELSAKLPEDQRKGFLGLVKSILSPAALISAATNDVQTYFGLNGIAISVGEAIETTIQQPNPLGGAALPATFQIRAESATSDSAVLTTKTTYGPAVLRELTRSLFAQAGKPIPPGELDKLPPMEMGDDGRFVYERSVGLMREVIVNRRVTAPPMQRLDRWEIRMLKSPTR